MCVYFLDRAAAAYHQDGSLSSLVCARAAAAAAAATNTGWLLIKSHEKIQMNDRPSASLPNQSRARATQDPLFRARARPAL